ncbi:uncharacterized protein MYCGRDRAFT_107149 [Zymoseptoria tritici IPO323]|uniref:Pal1 cell morphology protein n=1 Tax=Zymoseptoria tritici (strain CBS 115943 / IPO323) TaxID=336722 RepID=F9WXX7_ZYMTI|nr:uncharacterized protein MYCGRDRAFT_107149 [Zymoseptoria tritici IPO323]EGP91215.1 hypothetical protein MYCGRDRAFT_107149 [Zymoseptoria tritici IPO323]
MAFLADPPVQDRRPSPVGLSMNFSSNNPFRNRATSPLPLPRSASPHQSTFPQRPLQPSQRPMSRNPFFDPSEPERAPPRNKSVVANNFAGPDDIFSELSLLDRANTNEAVPRSMIDAPPSMPSRPPPNQRPAEMMPRDQLRGLPRGPDSPQKREHRPRRASESSIILEKERRPRMDRDRMENRERTASEEARRRERRKEREERHRREKEKVRAGGGGDKRHRKPQGLDIIDKLDVTGVYGLGHFHHDGPFDACNPHRNAKRDRRAPMQAFPAGSANMALGGAGPVSSRLDLDKFHGRGEESFMEFSATKKVDTTVVDPTMRIEPVHGEESYGLGTSTFLDGAPASRNALQRRVSEDPAVQQQASGLSRKKSIAQRFRGMSSARRNGSGETRSPEARYLQDQDRSTSPPNGSKAISAGGPVRARYNKENEVNPFDNDYEAAFEKKGTQIRIAEQERPSASRPRAGSNPNAALGLTRSQTSDAGFPTVKDRTRSSGEDDHERERQASAGGGGFLNRMKSLKGRGPRRPRNEA